MRHRKKDKNLLGPAIRELRMKSQPPVTQEELVARLVTHGVVLDRSALSRIEKKERHLLDFELIGICKALRVPVERLLK